MPPGRSKYPVNSLLSELKNHADIDVGDIESEFTVKADVIIEEVRVSYESSDIGQNRLMTMPSGA
jgi:hypothetical protein